MVVTGSCTSDTPGDFKAVDDVDTTVTNLQFPSGVTVILENTRNLPTDFCYQRIEVNRSHVLKNSFTDLLLR